MATYLGLALLIGALVAAVLGLRQLRLWTMLRRVEVATPEQLLDTARAGRLDPGLRAVVGTAAVGSQGGLTSTVNQVLCVWHRHLVEHQQVRYLTNSKGQRRRSTIYSTDGDTSSQEPFQLVGQRDQIEVQPLAMRIDRPSKGPDQTHPTGAGRQGGLRNLPKDGRTTHIYRHREWIIEPGAPLFILGEVTQSEVRDTAQPGTRVVIRRPARGPHLISTRDGRHLLRRSGLSALVSLILAGSLAGAGVLFVGGGDLNGVFLGFGLT